jgi:hypothetical protein
MQLQENSCEPCSRAVVKALVKFTKCSPHLSCAEVLLPVMLTAHAINEKDTVLQIITEALSSEHRENLLRYYNSFPFVMTYSHQNILVSAYLSWLFCSSV